MKTLVIIGILDQLTSPSGNFIGLVNWISAVFGLIVYFLIRLKVAMIKFENGKKSGKYNVYDRFSVRIWIKDEWIEFAIGVIGTVICVWQLSYYPEVMNPLTAGAVGTAGGSLFLNLSKIVLSYFDRHYAKK